MSDQAAWVALALATGIGPRSFARLIERFGSPAAALSAPAEELAAVRRMTPAMAAAVRQADIECTRRELAALGKKGISVLTCEDARYPANLALIRDAPPVLFVRGALQAKDERAVAIVGSREASEEGLRVAAELARGLAARGFAIVSGLARGIDTAAHRGALKGAGRTIAVLGGGIRAVHPRQNIALAEAIANGHGAILSELAPDMTPRAQTLIARDRLISGLARAVIVVEAQIGSGSVDTARRAKRQGRCVLAVQQGGPGAQDLIRGGARAIDGHGVDIAALAALLDGLRPGKPPEQERLL